MWGSDWPVLDLNGDYLLWHSVANTLLASLSDAEREVSQQQRRCVLSALM